LKFLKLVRHSKYIYFKCNDVAIHVCIANINGLIQIKYLIMKMKVDKNTWYTCEMH